MKKEKTFCPYCGTANLVNKQLLYVDEFGTHVFLCHLCKHEFSDISIREQEQETEKTYTNVLNQ